MNSKRNKIMASMVVMMMISVGIAAAVFTQDNSSATADASYEVDVAPNNRWTFTPAFPAALTDVTTTPEYTSMTGVSVQKTEDPTKFHKNTDDGTTVTEGGQYIFAETYTVRFSGSVQTGTDFVLSITGTSNLGGTQSYTVQYTFHINAGITVSGSQENIVSGESINFTPTSSTGIGTISWSVSGSLPAGLSKGTNFVTTGNIVGTPTTIGTNSFTLTAQAKDNNIVVDSKDLTVSFQVYNTIIGGSDETLTTYNGHVVSSTAINQTGSDLNVVWSQATTDTKTLAELGFTLNSATGVISGQNSSGSTYTVNLVGTDSVSGQTASKKITIITEKALTLTTNEDIAGREGVTYTRELVVANALNGYTFSNVSATGGVTASITGHVLSVSHTSPVESFTVTFTVTSTQTGQTAEYTLDGQLYPTTVITNPTMYVIAYEVVN